MKSLLTRLTENIGDEIAQNVNKNILNSLNESIDMDDYVNPEMLKLLKKEEPELAKKLEDFVKKNPKVKKVRPTRSSSSSSDWSDVGCGRSNRSSCGGSSHSYSDYGCGRSSRSGC